MTKAFFAATTAALIGLAVAAQAAAAPTGPLPQPVFKAGDSWVFDMTHQKGSSGYSQNRVDLIIERVSADTMVVGDKMDGSPANYTDKIMGLDWSKRVVLDGNQVVTARPFSFPLAVGSTWSSDYSTPPAGNQKSAHFHMTYKAVGWEDVTVPAGTFHALKVEEHGTGEAVLEIPAVAVSAATSSSSGANGMTHVQQAETRTIHATFYGESYYVPEIKYWVKHVNEQYNESSLLTNRDTESLVSFKLASAPPQAQPASAPQVQADDSTNICQMTGPTAPARSGSGTVLSFYDRAAALHMIQVTEAKTHGKIDPDYVDNQRVDVLLPGAKHMVVLVPKTMTVHVGDRVTYQGGYRNTKLPCNYIPSLVTEDAGPASGSAGPAQ